jgi:predicted PurR-regulated permease PerM
MASEEDSGVIYTVLIVCVLAILTFFVYKLYAKVNELFENLEGIRDEINTKETPVIDETATPSLEEVKDAEVDDPGTSQQHSEKKD